MPGSLVWSATYSTSGQILTEQDSNGAQTTRSMIYTYYPTGDRWAGLLKTLTDGSAVTRTNSYDDWLRVASIVTTGTLPEQQTTTSWQYDPRGFVTGIDQSFASTNTGPATGIQRSYDEYGQLGGETITLGGSTFTGASQAWDAAGRRTQLSTSGFGMNFSYRADGLMTAVNDATFGYGDNGLLTGRTNSFRSLTINQRDGVGRPLQATTRVLLSTVLTETWNWLNDGSPASYTAARSDFNDNKSFTYGPQHRRLTQESFNVSGGQTVTNSYIFDNGASGGLGVLTKANENSGVSNFWNGGVDALSRIVNETNSVAHRVAYGRVNGKATVTAQIDGRPVGVTLAGTNGGLWSTTLELTPGAHQLTATAAHPSGLFVTNATVWFTNNAADRVSDTYDGNGQVTQRIWVSAGGQTNRTQSLTWDAFGRLMKVNERDSQTNGYNWQTDFDPLGRRIRTTIVTVTNNVALSSSPSTIVPYYDPQVEFLEIGVNINGGLTTWKTYGPDLNGGYGDQQGVGGLEELTTGFITTGLIQDGFGNVLAGITNGVVTWNASRVNLYGAADGYPALSLSSSTLTPEHLAWRGKWRDVTSYYYWGVRPYDAERRAFMSTDPFGHAADPSLYSAFYGNPATYWDPDGRIGKQYGEFMYNGGAAGHGLRALGGAFQQIGSSTASTYLNWQANNNASFFNIAAGLVTPRSYVDSYNTTVDRSANVMAGEMVRGSGGTWAVSQGISSIVGDAVGYNNVMEGGFGVDRQTGQLLNGVDRTSRTLMGGSQLILTGVGLKATYQPGMANGFVRTASAVSDVPPIIADAARMTPTVDRIRNVAQQGYDYAVQNPRGAGLNRMQLGKDAEVQATRWLRRWAEQNDVNIRPGGLQFQVRGANSVPDVVFDPARQIFDFKLTPRAVRPTQTQNFGTDFPGYNVEYIFGP